MEQQEHIKNAVRIFKDGGIVIFPTDTAFGIGCRIDSTDAVEKVFSIRKRPLTQPTPVLVGSIEMAKGYVEEIPLRVQERLIDRYWPGALTIVLPSSIEKVPSLVRGGGLTVGVRMPNNNTLLEIITTLGIPIIGPSANFHGDPTPFQLSDVHPQLLHLVDYVMPGVCRIQRESTVIDCTTSHWKILRQGGVTLEDTDI